MSDWIRHSGGPCPVGPEAWVELPAGTQHSSNGRGTIGPLRAGGLDWTGERTHHLRHTIQSYRMMTDAEAAEAARHTERALASARAAVARRLAEIAHRSAT